ncbi:MAG TPA: NUDIX domain-containing protein [Candidatus Paceibacterota bacterium]|nr:NUDIX domain-containing protein [Candidatus Paceibacterota bacterium]
MEKIKFAPKEIFEQILEWAVIPTFDLVIEYGDQGVIIVKRKIPPYQSQWALPGLRMFKGENIEETLVRIADKELGLKIDPSQRKFLGQYVGKFSTEHNRQDLSTGYSIRIQSPQLIKPNDDHFSSIMHITSREKIPPKMGTMYKFYLNKYFD